LNKLAFHDADTDTDTDSDSSDMSIYPYDRYARFPHEYPHEEVRVGVGVRVGAVECQLYRVRNHSGLYYGRGGAHGRTGTGTGRRPTASTHR